MVFPHLKKNYCKLKCVCALDKIKTDYLTLCVGYSLNLHSAWKRSWYFELHSTHLSNNRGGGIQFPGTPTMKIFLSKQNCFGIS